MTFLAIINLLAICVIAYYAFESHRLAKNSHKQEKNFRETLNEINEKHQQELRDLYQAIVISTIMSGNSNSKVVKDTINLFKQHYSGKVEIFKNDNKKSE